MDATNVTTTYGTLATTTRNRQMGALSNRIAHLKRKGRMRGRKGPSREKARLMLHEGTVHGKPITDKQRGLFGLIASGRIPRRSK